jgi:DNA-binding response OmpR family regulator
MARQSLLLVEMDPQVADALELFLRGRSYRVTAAATPAEAMRWAAGNEPIDVVIIGSIPDTTDAEAVATRLRTILAPRAVAVIAMAATMDDLPGVDLVIPRDAHPRAILDALRTVSRKRVLTGPIAIGNAS